MFRDNFLTIKLKRWVEETQLVNNEAAINAGLSVLKCIVKEIECLLTGCTTAMWNKIEHLTADFVNLENTCENLKASEANYVKIVLT